MLSILTIPVTELGQNCRVLYTPDKKCVVVDPGGDADKIIAQIEKHGLMPVEIYLTHSHFDHCGGVAQFLKKYPNLPLYGHPNERSFRARVTEVASLYGLGPGFENSPEPTTYLSGGEKHSILGLDTKVLFVPGHSPGHLCFYIPSEKVLVAGDTIFAGSIGRTDLPWGDHELFIKSIKEKLMPLPDDTKVLPGHGPDTLMGEERVGNHFLQNV